MKNNLLKSLLTIIFVVTVVAVFVLLAKPNDRLTKVTEKESLNNVVLQENINAFMEARVGPDDLGHDNYYCINQLYGYDEQYAYAWVYCGGFLTKTDGSLEHAMGFGMPIRFYYELPDLEITGWNQPEDGEGYGESIRNLFPEQFYQQAFEGPSSAEAELMEEQLRIKAENNSKSENINSSIEVLKIKPGAIKSIKMQSNNQWLLAVDILSPNSKWSPGNNESFFLNPDPKIFNLSVTSATKTYRCGGDDPGTVLTNNSDFLNYVQNSQTQAEHDPTSLSEFGYIAYFEIEESFVVAIHEKCLP